MIEFVIKIDCIKTEKAFNAMLKISGDTPEEFFKKMVNINEDLIGIVEGVIEKDGMKELCVKLFGQETFNDLIGILS